ncbi:hypothetical protein ANN_27039 [Periplaneta americana]|uniref:DDE Tnp4 domain-containing protein n=1 Tax=Periplaneta americana TaxID=6978 RepID=A0ABQ8RX20_PERAM|nr:hypothetical protein ANN_27039 [Periplaneta americana]
MAICDANYCFTLANAGCQGRILDGGVFRETTFFKKMDTKTLNLPSPEPLPGREVQQPYVILGDDAFALSENLMKPLPWSLFGHGLQKKKWVRRIYASPGSFDSERQNGTIVSGALRNITQGDTGVLDLQRLPRRLKEAAKAIRDEFKTYFVLSEGSVPWQGNYI